MSLYRHFSSILELISNNVNFRHCMNTLKISTYRPFSGHWPSLHDASHINLISDWELAFHTLHPYNSRVQFPFSRLFRISTFLEGMDFCHHFLHCCFCLLMHQPPRPFVLFPQSVSLLPDLMVQCRQLPFQSPSINPPCHCQFR